MNRDATKRLILTAAASAAGSLMLSGCISTSNSAAVSDLPANWRTDARVESVTLQRSPDLKVSPEFDALFTERVQARVATCATGSRALRLEARLDKLTKANPFVTAVVFGQNKVRGSARLVDVATGQVIGEYTIGRTVTGSRLGAIAMAEAEEQMSDGFGAEICRQAFSGEAR